MKPSARIPRKRLGALNRAIWVFPDAIGDVARAVITIHRRLIGEVVCERIGRPCGEEAARMQGADFQLMRARRKFHHRAPLHGVGADAEIETGWLSSHALKRVDWPLIWP